MFEIRQAEMRDLATLKGLIETLGFRKDDGYFEHCLSGQEQGRWMILLAEREGRAVGYGMLNWQPKYALYKKLNIPEIQDLNVIPDFRRQGAATAMIRHCEAVAQARGCTQTGISVGLYAGYGPAQRLYVSLGYMPDGCGVTYDRQPVAPMEMRPVDDDLCLMMVRDLV